MPSLTVSKQSTIDCKPVSRCKANSTDARLKAEKLGGTAREINGCQNQLREECEATGDQSQKWKKPREKAEERAGEREQVGDLSR
jgi:outer membrane murein-binding lipoprotein Lpp